MFLQQAEVATQRRDERAEAFIAPEETAQPTVDEKRKKKRKQREAEQEQEHEHAIVNDGETKKKKKKKTKKDETSEDT